MADSILGRASDLVDDCIVAVSTPAGRGAIGIVRLSGGSDAIAAVLGRLLGDTRGLEDRRLALRTLRDAQGDALDRGLVVWFRGPDTYTGEDVAELHLHGNPVVLRSAVDACVQAGARHAEPGEFTRRAVGNGKLSLLHAEAIDALIRAPGEAAARIAQQQLGGALQSRLDAWIEELEGLAVALEAIVDFPDEVDEREITDAMARLGPVHDGMRALLDGAASARRLLDGVRVAIVGPVNAGKSTLLNQLLGHDRAIVSPTAGTTRDVVSESVEWGGLTVRLEDTAGLREAADPVEMAGIVRSKEARDAADVVVEVRDGRQLDPGCAPLPGVSVATHGDHLTSARAGELGRAGWHVVDGQRGLGVAPVRDAIRDAALADVERTEAVLHTARQEQAMRDAEDAMAEARDLGLEEPVLCAVAVRRAGRALEELTGAWTDERVLDALFARFCIGK